MITSDIQNIIWDWNCTLLDDVDLCIRTLNELLEDRNLVKINYQTYRNHFTFPVIQFYEYLGFDFTSESFVQLSDEYMIKYNHGLKKALLSNHAVDSLKAFKKWGKIQYMLSAMEQTDLKNSLINKGIKHYFARVYGNPDKLAAGKIELAKKMFEDYGFEPCDTLLIGDTLHDYEVARAIGCHVVLVANGHQDSRRFANTKAIVVNDLAELLEKFNPDMIKI